MKQKIYEYALSVYSMSIYMYMYACTPATGFLSFNLAYTGPAIHHNGNDNLKNEKSVPSLQKTK